MNRYTSLYKKAKMVMKDKINCATLMLTGMWGPIRNAGTRFGGNQLNIQCSREKKSEKIHILMALCNIAMAGSTQSPFRPVYCPRIGVSQNEENVCQWNTRPKGNKERRNGGFMP